MTRAECTEALVGHPAGTYVLRESHAEEGRLILSALENDGERVAHYVLERGENGQYVAGDIRLPLGDMIAHLKQALGLTEPY